MTPVLDDTTVLKYNEPYIIKIRNYDMRSNAEAWVHYPFIMSWKTSTHSITRSSQGTLGLGITSASVGTTLDKLSFVAKNEQEATIHFHLKSNTLYTLNFDSIIYIASQPKCKMRMVNNKGEIVWEKQPKVQIIKNKTSLEIDTQMLNKGYYTLWIRMEDLGGKCIGMSIPIGVEQTIAYIYDSYKENNNSFIHYCLGNASECSIEHVSMALSGLQMQTYAIPLPARFSNHLPNMHILLLGTDHRCLLTKKMIL